MHLLGLDNLAGNRRLDLYKHQEKHFISRSGLRVKSMWTVLGQSGRSMGVKLDGQNEQKLTVTYYYI